MFKSEKVKLVLEAFSDAEFAGDFSASKSTSGTRTRFISGPISWESYLQREVVLSATEAEYLVATEAYRELLWIKSLLEELGLTDQIE